MLKLCKFRYPSVLKSSFVSGKKLFIFISVKEGFDATVLSSFLEKLMLVFVFLLIYFMIHLEYILDKVGHTVRVWQVSHFCHPA